MSNHPAPLPPSPWTSEFATAGKIVFGDGVLDRLGGEARLLGQRALVVHGQSARNLAQVKRLLEAAGVASAAFPVAGEPDIPLVLGGIDLARSFRADLVIGVGGGSVIDAAKAIAALATNPGDPLDYLEIVGTGKPLASPPLPCIAVPTTAGTGAEVTRNAVLTVPDQLVKVSLRSPAMLPRLALVDPVLTWDLPPEQTAWSGLDALVQLMEAFVCNKPNPLVDALCRDGLPRVARSLRAAWVSACDRSGDSPDTRSPHTPAETSARREMAMASLLGGMALANARLGVIHGLAGPLGGWLKAPHGAICSGLLLAAYEENLQAVMLDAGLQERQERFDELSRLLCGRASADARDAASFFRELVQEMEIPRLAHWGLDPGDFDTLIPMAKRSGSMQGNPVALGDAALENILQRSM